MRFVTDENFNNRIWSGLLRRDPTLDIVRVIDAGLQEQDDAVILKWAAQESRILLTHDVETMIAFAYDRVDGGLKMPGVFAVPQLLPVGRAIDEIILIAECSEQFEWEGQVLHLPL